MAKKSIHHVKLGIFITAGIAFLILLLYTIGKNHHLFGNTFELKARFRNARGLMPGNNVRYSGIDAGTVQSVRIIDDSTIEASLLVKTEMKDYIRKNAVAFISTDGIMGNKLVNIEPSRIPAPAVQEGDILLSKRGADTDEMLSILSNTNNDLAIIASSLRSATSRINASKSVWAILEDSTLPQNIRLSFRRFREAGENMDLMMKNLSSISGEIRQGRGTIGQLLRDTAISYSLKDAIGKIRKSGDSIDSISLSITHLIDSVSDDINHSRGLAGAILNDSSLNNRFSSTLNNLEEGTRAFNENMEALKHNFFFRGYFRKIEKKK